MTSKEVLDIYFMDARSRLIDLAAFIDRMRRSSGEADYRMEAFLEALAELASDEPNAAIRVLRAFSDPTTEPILHAKTKAATGAWSTTTGYAIH
jgi:hypothetical protein